jgi:hypothetical protein
MNIHKHTYGPRTSKKVLATVTAAVVLVALGACSAGDDESLGAATDPQTSASAPGSVQAATPSAFSSASATPSANTREASSSGDTPIVITAGGQRITATLNNSQVSQDFAAMLPVTLPWYRNYEIEYITELDEPLTETGPFYTTVEAGDLVYYNPMDSITIIYDDTSSVPTLTKMGEITSDLDVFKNLPDNVDMRIELG